MGYLTRKEASVLIDKYGFSLFPTHGIVNGACTCGNDKCTSPGKHPLTSDGFYSATKDINKLVELVGGKRGFNIGVRTGAESGVFVIDIDGPEGEETWLDILNKHAATEPETLKVRTGRGRHLYFRYIPDIKWAKHLGHKIDIKSDGGYVMAPGCNHISGKNYDIISDLPITQAPEWLAKAVVRQEKEVKVFAGLNLVDSIRSGLNLGTRHTDAEVSEMLSKIDPDISHDEWVAIGMALHDGGYPFHIWDNWSKGGRKYTGDTGNRWRSFHGGGGVSMGTLVKMAKDNGYTQTSKDLAYKRLDPSPVDQPQSAQASPLQAENQVENAALNPAISALDNKIEAPLLYYIKDGDIEPSIDTSDFVQGLLTDGALSVVYGPSNCGKTFFMTDLAFKVATGAPWRGKRVEQGGVVYVALEGSYGLKNRIAAYKSKFGSLNGQFAMVPCAVDFFDPESNIAEFIALLKTAQEDLGSVRLVVIDTLSRALAGGDENSGKDMGMLVKHADLIRQLTGAHVCFIHHSGKDEAKGARGHSSLRAAVDTEIEITRDEKEDFSRVKIVKQREMEMEKEMQFALEVVSIGVNKYNEEVTSCVVVPIEAEERKKERSMTAIQTRVYDSIVDALITKGQVVTVVPGMPPIRVIDYDTLRTNLYEKGFARMIDKNGNEATPEQVKSTTQTARIALAKMNKIGFNKDYIWLI